MRRVVLALAAATALSFGSAASAAVTVSGATGLNAPNPATDPNAIATVGNVTTVNFGQNAVDSPNFSASFTLHNDAAGLYSVILETSYFGTVVFDSASFGGNPLFQSQPDGSAFRLNPTYFGVGDYLFALAGHNNDVGGSFTGNITIRPAVPEPGTWALMLVGFGGIGLALRRRRTLAAQTA